MKRFLRKGQPDRRRPLDELQHLFMGLLKM
jgi:hypothetical protein